MANYQSDYTGIQIDTAVGSLTNKGLDTALGGVLHRDSTGNFSIVVNELEEENSNTLSLTTKGEKYNWNHILDSNGKLPINRLPNEVVLSSEKGQTIATLENGKIPQSQLPSYVDDVLEFATIDDFPVEGETAKIYVDLDSNKTYRWGGSQYVEISASLTLGETSTTAYQGDKGATAYAHAVTNKGNQFNSGFYKIETNAEGHVVGAIGVDKSDITRLGIPGTIAITNVAPGPSTIATITIDGVSTNLYAPYAAMTSINAKNQDGYVPGPTNTDSNKVWSTDAQGNPSWNELDVSTATNTQITLTTSGWNSSNIQEIVVQGMTANTIVVVSPTPADLEDYSYYGILCIAQSTNALAFKCDKVPTRALTVNILTIK